MPLSSCGLTAGAAVVRTSRGSKGVESSLRELPGSFVHHPISRRPSSLRPLQRPLQAAKSTVSFGAIGSKMARGGVFDGARCCRKQKAAKAEEGPGSHLSTGTGGCWGLHHLTTEVNRAGLYMSSCWGLVLSMHLTITPPRRNES